VVAGLQRLSAEEDVRSAGFDLEAYLCKLFGSRLTKPLTKYHGAQIATVFKRQAELWDTPGPFSTAVQQLEKDDTVGVVVRDLKGVFAALSVVHKQVSIPDPDLDAMQKASQSFASCARTFEFGGTPRPCRYRLKFYDHAVINHIVDMSKVLKERGLSLAVVSSKFLEANNKVVKAIMRRLPGGGRHTGSCAHLPLVQGLKRCIAASRVRRLELYKSIQNKEGDETVLD
jgi:hypothetical protein